MRCHPEHKSPQRPESKDLRLLFANYVMNFTLTTLDFNNP